MKPVDARTRIEVLDPTTCLELLAQDVVGRVAVVVGGSPMVVVVNYALDGSDVVFRSDAGTKVDMGVRAPACFEIDGFDREARTGWSVVVAGRLEEVTRYDRATWDRITQLPVDPWAAGEKSRWMRIIAETVTGRRVGPG
jgi:nitroimidazol reductase NimA-like FMN-containing flavoprotein (pyridoxamine 5'-phosphate oxidase superfamily)